MTRFITALIYVEHVLLSPFGDAAAAESLQMAFARSVLAITDVKQFFDLTHLRAGQLRGCT